MKTLKFEVPDEFYEAFQEIAAKEHCAVEDVALEWLAKEAVERRKPKPSKKERRAGLKLLREFCGAVNSGDPHSGDNDRIDADLAREYGSTHEEER